MLSDGAVPQGKDVHVTMPLMEEAVHTDPRWVKAASRSTGREWLNERDRDGKAAHHHANTSNAVAAI